MAHVIKDVLKIETNGEDTFNYCIYLLEKGRLPSKQSDIVCFLF
jgi:hypothetical protein